MSDDTSTSTSQPSNAQDDDVIRITEEDLQQIKNDPLVVTAMDFIGMQNTVTTGKIDWNPTLNAPTKAAVDVVLCIDTSGSMGALDYSPNRLQAAKDAARLFAQQKVMKNYNDQVGVVGFGGHAHTQFPLTSDMKQAQTAIDALNITHTGTMIGEALETAAALLTKTKSSKRAIILLSDGGDNYDTSKPLDVAKGFDKIVVFTIGIGTPKGSARLPHGDQQVPLNEDLLRRIAKATGGDYLFAPDVTALQGIYAKLAHY